MRFLISFISLLLSGTAFGNTTWTENAVLIERGSELHTMIDEITLEIFKSPLKNDLCTVYRNPTSVYHSLGVSEKTALAIFKDCKPVAAAPTKVMSKQYYLSFASEPRLDSWTDYGNRTYIFANEGLTRSHLKSIILHEIAMSTDAKTNMMYTGYLMVRDQERTYTAKNGSRIISIGSLSERERTLQTAFNMAAWGPMSRTFAALRAFQLEMMAEGVSFNFKNHHLCSRIVRETFYKTQYLPEPPKSSGIDSMAEMLAEAFDTHQAPQTREQEQELLNFLLSKDLMLKDSRSDKVTFCQFMTEPLLTSRSLYTFLSAGPRPRLTGGSGGQGKDDSDKNSMSLDSAMKMIESRKDLRVENQKLRETIQRLKDQQRFNIAK